VGECDSTGPPVWGWRPKGWFGSRFARKNGVSRESGIEVLCRVPVSGVGGEIRAIASEGGLALTKVDITQQINPTTQELSGRVGIRIAKDGRVVAHSTANKGVEWETRIPGCPV